MGALLWYSQGDHSRRDRIHTLSVYLCVTRLPSYCFRHVRAAAAGFWVHTSGVLTAGLLSQREYTKMLTHARDLQQPKKQWDFELKFFGISIGF